MSNFNLIVDLYAEIVSSFSNIEHPVTSPIEQKKMVCRTENQTFEMSSKHTRYKHNIWYSFENVCGILARKVYATGRQFTTLT